jgi:hypothetical protein
MVEILLLGYFLQRSGFPRCVLLIMEAQLMVPDTPALRFTGHLEMFVIFFLKKQAVLPLHSSEDPSTDLGVNIFPESFLF